MLVKVPNEAFAQQAGLSLDETMRFFFDASLRDWTAESERLRGLCERFGRPRRSGSSARKPTSRSRRAAAHTSPATGG